MLPSQETSPGLSRPPRRRNGRQQACEPCRRRKVSCGHEVPVCLRCKRTKSASSCVYLIGGRPAEFELPSPTPSERPMVSFVQADENELAKTSGTTTAVTSPSYPDYGYLGPTSYSGFMCDLDTSQSRDEPGNSRVAAITEANDILSPSSISAPKKALAPNSPYSALEVLRLIPDRRTGEILFRWHVNANDSWIRPAAEQMIGPLWQVFGRSLRAHADPVMLQEMAQQLTLNTNRPLIEETDPTRWLASFSGKNMRWEGLALLFTFWAFGSWNYQGQDVDGLEGLWKGGRDRRKSMLKYKECAATCIALANPSRNANSLLLHALYRYGILVSNVVGDANLEVWKIHAETIAMLTFMGMHAEQPSPSYKPSALSESKRRILCGLFNADKKLATFAGRPPLLGRKYVSTPLPLDLENDALLAGGARLDAAVRDLDENGWNRKGYLNAATLLRARTMLYCNRDLILEVALGIHFDDISPDAVVDLRNRELETVRSFPRVLAYHEEDIKELLAHHADDSKQDEGVGAALYSKLVVRLEHLQNMFFLERLLLKKSSQLSLSLLTVSLDIISLTLSFWMYKSRLYDLHGDLDCLLVTFAAPSSGILCQQLKSPMQHDDPKLSRSIIIQKLSQLLGFLDYVGPTAANIALCHNVKRIIQHVLDHELSNSNGPFVELPSNNDNILSGDWNDFQFSGFDLLDTFDWVRPDTALDSIA